MTGVQTCALPISGYYETGSNKLYIENSTSSSPLVWGDFALNRVVINGNATHNANARTFFSNGTAGGTSAWYNDSDANLKKNINTIQNPLSKVLNLRGVNYEWKDSDNREKGVRMGFVAQEVQSVVPEVVSNENGTYSMQYSPLTALLVEAIKEQQQIIEQQNKELQELRNQVEAINKLLSK